MHVRQSSNRLEGLCRVRTRRLVSHLRVAKIEVGYRMRLHRFVLSCTQMLSPWFDTNWCYCTRSHCDLRKQTS